MVNKNPSTVKKYNTPLELASLDSLTIGYIVTDIDHNILLINYAAKDLLVITKQISSLEQVVDHLPKHLVLLDHVKYCSIEHKSCSFREVNIGDKKLSVFLSPLFEGGELKGNLLTLEDITERIDNEHARDQFLSFLVHELRTPITAIKGNASLIRDHYQNILKDQDLSELVGDISTGSDSLLQIVNQFLDMSRLEEGRIKYNLQQFDLLPVIIETVNSLNVIAKLKNGVLKLTPSEIESMQVVGDPGRVKQVLTNLIGNAIKFSEGGTVTVSVRQNDVTQELEILVKDNGAGIPLDSRSGMFQKYFQASNNKFRGDSAKSTGLGLYVTRLIVEGMGGRILLLESEVGKGSTFMFSISLATPKRLTKLKKQLAELEQGVEHAPAAEHQSINLRN